MVEPESRLPDARRLIARGQYFVVHAPRQTGKTTTLSALARGLTAEGEYAAVLFSCERAEVAGDDYPAAELQLLDAIRDAGLRSLPAEMTPPRTWPEAAAGSRLYRGLQAWAAHCPQPLVLLIDEIDALRGESLRSVLRQLRDGFRSRPAAFPASIVLCGLRDVRDYRAASGGDPERLGTSSPFNVKVTSLRIGAFSEEEVRSLYWQHTADTGQEFTPEATDRAYEYTQGQPWLVNALAAEVIDNMRVEPPVPVTAEHIDQAKERLIQARATHLDSLAAKLYEPRVKRVIEPLIAGELTEPDPTYNDDVEYVRDLGLIAPGTPVRPANPIYLEVIARVLGERTDTTFTADPHSFLLPGGCIDVAKLLDEFAGFWREHSDILTSGAGYNEAAPQLVMMGFLQRIVNGGGAVDREYGVGRGRIDLLIRKPCTDEDGKKTVQRIAFELKVWRAGRPDPLPTGLQQLDSYLDRMRLDTGVLAIFDRRPTAPPPYERVTLTTERSPASRDITVLRG
jgi:AAA domain